MLTTGSAINVLGTGVDVVTTADGVELLAEPQANIDNAHAIITSRRLKVWIGMSH